MKAFSKKQLLADFKAECPLCGQLASTNLTPEERKQKGWECDECEQKAFSDDINLKRPTPPKQPIEHGQKEISKFDDEYIFLTKLVNIVVKAGVPPQEIKELSMQQPFVTIDDVGDLAAKIWTLATTKYNIPREWLIKKLPEKKGSLNKKSDEAESVCPECGDEYCFCREKKEKEKKKADLWPAQEASESMLSHNHNSLSYNPLQENDTSVSGPRPDDVEKEGSPETNHQLYLSMGQDVINEYFFGKSIRWSQVVSFLKEQVPQLTDEDIVTLKTDTKQKLSQFGQQIQAKNKPLNIDKVIQTLNLKAPKVVHVDPIKGMIELGDGTFLSFDEATRMVMDMPKEGVFSGNEFSNTEFNVNPTLDLGPYSSPADQGATRQKKPFPNTMWDVATDDEDETQPYSNVASSLKVKSHCGPCSEIKATVLKMLADLKYKHEAVTAEDLEEMGKLSADPSNNSFINELGNIIKRLPKEFDKEIQKLNNHKLALEDIQKDIDSGDMIADKPFSKKTLLKKANPPSRFWIAPDGTEFPVSGVHTTWVKLNPEILKQYGFKTDKNVYNTLLRMKQAGWIRISNEPAGTGFQIEVNDINKLPSFVDDIVAKYFKPGDKIIVGNAADKGVEIENPFPTLQQAVNKALRQPVNASKKQADLSGQTVNQILQGIQANGGITYNLSQGNLIGTPNYVLSIHPDRERIVDGVDFDTLEGYINDNQDLLNETTNSLGVWSHDGKVYLDVVSVFSDRDYALQLAKEHNQLAIWDLANNQEISTGLVRAFSKKTIIKIAEEQILTQKDQNEIAAKWTPIMNIALNNYSQAIKNGHDPKRALKFAEESVINIGRVKESDLKEAISIYLEGLV